MVIVQFCGHLVRQYRACVVESLGLGITCVLYITYSTMCTRHPDLVSFAFYAIPHYNFIYLSLLILITIANLLIVLVTR